MTSINKSQSPLLDLLDKIYSDPSDIDRACKDYNALRREEQYADMKEEIEEEIEDLDLDLIWEAVGPDAYANHNAVAMEVRALIAEEKWGKLGRLLGEGAKAYLQPFAADKIKARNYD
jgi:hypothetical protein